MLRLSIPKTHINLLRSSTPTGESFHISTLLAKAQNLAITITYPTTYRPRVHEYIKEMNRRVLSRMHFPFIFYYSWLILLTSISAMIPADDVNTLGPSSPLRS